MSAEQTPKPVKVSKEDFDVISNRIAVALAKREALIKSWTASSSRERPPEKTEAELAAEDAALFRNEPAYLGVGAPIPSHFLVSEAERSNKSLRAKLFPSKTLKASKARDAEEKAASAKRGLRDGSSDEEEGRSGLARAKKRKTQTRTEPAKDVEELDHVGSVERPKLPKAELSVDQVNRSREDSIGNKSVGKDMPSQKDEGDGALGGTSKTQAKSKDHAKPFEKATMVVVSKKINSVERAASPKKPCINVGDSSSIPAILQSHAGSSVSAPKSASQFRARAGARGTQLHPPARPSAAPHCAPR